MTDIQRWTDDQLEKMSDDDMRDCVRYVRGTLQGLGLKTDATILTHAICKSIDQSATIARLEAELERVTGERDGLRVLHDSPTWPFVLAFAVRMEAKLAKNRHKGDRDGWLKDAPWPLFVRLLGEMSELERAIREGESPEDIADEAADVANFAMMVADSAALSARQNNDAASVAGKVE